MKAVALQSTSYSAPVSKPKAAARPVPVSPCFTQPVSAIDHQVIQRKSACACGGGCPRCASESHHPSVQTKLTVSTPGDQYEQEADRVADQVVRMDGPPRNNQATGFTTAAGSVVQRKCAKCEDEEAIQKKELEGHEAGSGYAREAPSIVHEALRSPGQPLDAATRAFMEPRLGHDFSQVRVHADAQAATSARRIGALAFTAGRDIVFGNGQFAPETVAGQKLLAHELTHVIQQEGSASRGVQRDVDPAVEEEVERAGEDFRRDRRRDLSRIIDRMPFRKIPVDCPRKSGVRLLDVLSRMRSRVNANQACLRFFQKNFRLSPDRFFLPNRNPTITVDATLEVSGRTRCPEPAVLIQSPLCASPHRERIIMHELTHYAGCLTAANTPSSEELAEQGANVCMGTVQEALEDARRQGRVAPTTPPPPQPPQHKLIHDQPGDQYEQEADRVAEQVMRMPAPIVRRSFVSSSTSDPPDSECEMEELVRRKAAKVSPGSSSIADNLVRNLGSGQPLDMTTRAFMEPRFSHDFSEVRVHTGARAAESARAVNALAYSMGSHIAFASGQYDPAGSQGQRLLAHELTHVIQQIGSRGVRAGGSMDARSSITTLSSAVEVGLQRKALEEDDPVHGPLIEDFRHRHGLPPSGLEESGESAGPTDAEIKYLLFRVRKQICPEVGDTTTRDGRRRALCASDQMKKEPADCHFTDKQKEFLREAKREAASRARRALARTQAGREGERLAAELAGQLFLIDRPSVAEVKEVLGKVHEFLSGSGVEFVAKGCGQPDCQSGATVAYVTAAGTMPIYICPLAFASLETLPKTIIHEALHWSGLDADPSTLEGYCEKFDCITPCLSRKDADAWAHYVACLGEPLEMRRSFRDKILESVDEIP